MSSFFVSFISKLCLYGSGAKVSIKGVLPSIKSPFLIVSNHVGMFDILLISRLFPSVFVTSYELKEMPLVGTITEAGGCVYVERRNRNNIHQEIKNIEEALSLGTSVTFFPEAQSTNGDQVLPFKKSLFMSAVVPQVPILPLTINYKKINNQVVTENNRDHVCWYGDRSFFNALWGALSLNSLEVEITIHSSLMIKTLDQRGEIAEQAHNLISNSFQSLKSKSTQTA